MTELLSELEEQERRLVFDAFDEATAWTVGVALRDAGLAAGLPIAISIRRNGQELFHAALPGASADNDGWLARKSAVVDRYGQSSLRVGETFRSRDQSFDVDSQARPRDLRRTRRCLPDPDQGHRLRRLDRGVRPPPARRPQTRRRDPEEDPQLTIGLTRAVP